MNQLPNGMAVGFGRRSELTEREYRRVISKVQALGRDVDGLLSASYEACQGVSEPGNWVSIMPWVDFPDGGFWMVTGTSNLSWLYTGEATTDLTCWRMTLCRDDTLLPAKPETHPMAGRRLEEWLTPHWALESTAWLDWPNALIHVAATTGYWPYSYLTMAWGMEYQWVKPGLRLIIEVYPEWYLKGVKHAKENIHQRSIGHDQKESQRPQPGGVDPADHRDD